MRHALVIEDQDLMRLALIHELQAFLNDCTVFGAPNLDIALSLLDQHEMDLLLIDPGLPGFDPTSQSDRLEVVERLIENSPSALHLIITGSDAPKEAERCIALGASGYVSKNGLMRGLLGNIVHDISRTGCSIRLAEDHRPSSEHYYPGLTPREQDIVQWMIHRPRGTTRQELFVRMGEHFGIDPGSVERYYKEARAKLIKSGKLPEGV